MNSGSDAVSTQLLLNNIVVTDDTDTTYQCFGTCDLSDGSANNTACGKNPASTFDKSDFVINQNCDDLTAPLREIRGMYTYSGMKTCAQYTPFIIEDPTSCREPSYYPCCYCNHKGNRCNTTRSVDPDVCCNSEDNFVSERLSELIQI